MKQRAIKRCIKRAQKRPQDKRKVPVTYQAAGAILVSDGKKSKYVLHITQDDVGFQSSPGFSLSWGHRHWLRSNFCVMALSHG